MPFSICSAIMVVELVTTWSVVPDAWWELFKLFVSYPFFGGALGWFSCSSYAQKRQYACG